jgi:AraC family transcriptional regulator, regulatory protein of adaptative response / methylated-DNA-[protein]-cysteine methyltransferase
MRAEMKMVFDEEAAWRQVLERDTQAEFFYGVTTTGIFCRASCPSRRPARSNARFFESAEIALGAGYRACMRCKPEQQRAETVLVDTVCAHLRANVERKITLSELAELTGMSPFTVQRTFVRVLGVSPSAYQRELRSKNLKQRLSGKGGSVTEAIYDAGYSSASRVYENAGRSLGMSPGKFQARGKGERIRFTVTDCHLGKLLVAATDRGICAVTLGEDGKDLETKLRAQFPAAEIVADTGLNWVTRVILLANGEGPLATELPLDLRATAFQMRVWQALQQIPTGETRSYAEVAKEIGQPTAVRAVARACASNPLAVVIPCHRVVGSDGSLTGYRWGVERKRKLLAKERSGTAEVLSHS